VLRERRLWMIVLLAGMLPWFCGIAGAQRQAAHPAFTFEALQRLALERASHPYESRSPALPEGLAKLSYEQYRGIHFRRPASLWYERSLFEIQFFHRGFNFDRRVNISEVGPAGVRPISYSPAMFELGSAVTNLRLTQDLGFAGFAVHYPLTSPQTKDEVMVFLGASFFRVLGRNQVFGLSARGLAIDTASAAGEEFPYFTDFWLVRPEPQARALTIYALLDSPSISGAYQFEVQPGALSRVLVSAQLYPRRAIQKLGLAPLTSMYLHGDTALGKRFDDYRPQVHDSDGLMIQRGTGEWQWRPLVNPVKLRVNRFMDQKPRGFGLIQRERDFSSYQDADSRFELRPSYWIVPQGDWGRGGVELVEIPSEEEIHDNVAAYWVPDTPVAPLKPLSFSYVLFAYLRSCEWPPGGRAIATRFGRVTTASAGTPVGARRLMIDFAGGDLDSLAANQPVQAAVSASGGEVDSVTVQRLPGSMAWRVAMRLKPAGDHPIDLRCYLTLYGEALTETWTYLWNPAGA
jgi:periplasmic glucans biosynthesis protein